MTPRFLTKSFALVAACMALACGAAAQSVESLSEEEIAERFKNQKTRGLAIAPSGDASTAPTVAENDEVPTSSVTAENVVFANIAFDFDSAALREDQKDTLTKLCNVISEIDIDLFEIIGHTDSSGSADYNQRLSRLRAEEVKRFMVGDCGIDPTRLIAVGLGESSPLNADNPRADENRRVEFQVSS